MAGALKPNNVIRIPCTLDSLFRYWLEFLIPFHNLTSRETDVATAFLKERYNLSKVILDKDLVDRTLMSEESQRKLKQECGLTNQHFQVIKSKLKNKKFFISVFIFFCRGRSHNSFNFLNAELYKSRIE